MQAPIEANAKSALNHHLDLHDQLTSRDEESLEYSSILEEVLGFSIRNTLISTAEHAAPFNYASSVSFLLPQMVVQMACRRATRPILMLVGSLVPFDNAHYPRGFLLENGRSINLFTQRVQKSCPLLQPPATIRPGNEANRFLQTFPWLRPQVTGAIAFSDAAQQISNIMEAIAGRWFAGHSRPATILPLEEVARRMLIRLLDRNDGWLDRLLFDSSTRRGVMESLMGTFCAWGARHGSFLFWNRLGDRLGRFVEDEGCLAGSGVRVRLTRGSIRDGLETKSILPGVFLSLLAVSFLPGLPVCGGPKQPEYYRTMIRAANAVGTLKRTEKISTYGYTSVDMSQLTTNPTAARPIPKTGAGLALANGTGDPEWLCQQLSLASFRPPPAMPGYD
jgi:hypothetical protein